MLPKLFQGKEQFILTFNHKEEKESEKNTITTPLSTLLDAVHCINMPGIKF